MSEPTEVQRLEQKAELGWTHKTIWTPPHTTHLDLKRTLVKSGSFADGGGFGPFPL